MSSVYEDSLVAAAAYEDGDWAREILQEMGWIHVGDHHDIFNLSLSPEVSRDIIKDATDSGYHAEVFASPDGQLVIGNRGTEFSLNQEGVKDIVTDVQLSVGAETIQAEVAVELLNAIGTQYSPESIHVSGHSLGGYLSQKQDYAEHNDESGLRGENRNIRITGTALDAPGIGDVQVDVGEGVLLINDSDDRVNRAGGDHFGQSVDVASPGEGLIESHRVRQLVEYLDDQPWARLSSQQILSTDGCLIILLL